MKRCELRKRMLNLLIRAGLDLAEPALHVCSALGPDNAIAHSMMSSIIAPDHLDLLGDIFRVSRQAVQFDLRRRIG